MTKANPMPAARLKLPSWRDPRLLIGILLVLASVASVVALVGGADKTIEVYAARTDLAVGQRITADRLVKVRARLGAAESAYLLGRDTLPESAVALRRVPQGELLAKSGVGHADALQRKPAALSIDEPLPREATVGSYVDVWASLPDSRNGYGEPRKLLAAAEIAELTPSSSALGGSKSTQLQVLVGEAQLPALLSALANEAKIAVVWDPGGGQ